jgi:hypothetical protein
MGAAVGGSVEAVDIKGRNFPVAADADANRSLGGFTNEVSANGDGTARILKTRVPWNLDGLALEINNDRQDLEFLQDVANSLDFVPMTITFADGNTYMGPGMITGDVKASSATATAPIGLMGPGELSIQ